MQTTSNISETAGPSIRAPLLRRAVPAVLMTTLVVAALGGWYAIISVGLSSLR
jgi:hypothetical protein